MLLQSNYLDELEHGRFGEMSKGQKAETAIGGAAIAGILYEVRSCCKTRLSPLVRDSRAVPDLRLWRNRESALMFFALR